jgi:uncharacterized membrane protein YbhN (UPF0104 family)
LGSVLSNLKVLITITYIYRGNNIKPDSKKKVRLVFKIVIAAALLYYLINYVSYQEIFIAVKQSNKYYIFFVVVLMTMNIYLQYLKWRVVCYSLLNIRDDHQIMKSLFYGFSAGIITPVRVGEYLGRQLAFRDVGLLKVTISTIIEKFASLFIVLTVGSIASIYFLIVYYSFPFSIPIILFLIGILTLASFVIRGYNFSSSIFSNLAERYDFVNKIKIELKYVREINSRSINLLMVYSLLFYFVVILQYALLAKAFDQTGSIFMFLVAGIIVIFVKSILSFLSFADLGIRESTSVFLMNKMGYSIVVGFNSAIFLFLINLVIPSIIGAFLLFRKDNENNIVTKVE